MPLGGLNGYRGVRGKLGRGKNMFQGITQKNYHGIKLYGTALEAAVALAQLQEDLELGMPQQRGKKKAASPIGLATSKTSRSASSRAS